MIKKILLLGSAGYVKDWYAVNGPKFLQNGFSLYAMNNAWAVDPDNLRVWMHAEDYGMIQTSIKPTDQQRQKWIEVTRWNDIPFLHEPQRRGPCNSSLPFAKRALPRTGPVFIAIAGADQTYGGPKTGSYGTGNTGPMKFGKEFIAEVFSTSNTPPRNSGTRS